MASVSGDPAQWFFNGTFDNVDTKLLVTFEAKILEPLANALFHEKILLFSTFGVVFKFQLKYKYFTFKLKYN